MADRIISMRTLLRQHLEGLGSKWTWVRVLICLVLFYFSILTMMELILLLECAGCAAFRHQALEPT